MVGSAIYHGNFRALPRSDAVPFGGAADSPGCDYFRRSLAVFVLPVPFSYRREAITTTATKQAEHFLEGIGAVRWYGNSLTVDSKRAHISMALWW